MSHSSAFLLPSPSAAAAGADADGAAYALLVLNQRLPRFAPRLWDCGSRMPSLAGLRAWLFSLLFSSSRC
jgi:hypothetical protein